LKNPRIRKQKGKINKIQRMIRLFRIRIRTRLPFSKRQSRISSRRHSISPLTGNGTYMTRRKAYGFSRMNSRHKRWK
jgi:hypothetical protein